MGCDIHAHIEVKIAGKWQHYSDTHIVRNYRLFGHLAGVRFSDLEQVAPVRGIPKDATQLTRIAFEEWESDAHTPSWVTMPELKKAAESSGLTGYTLGTGYVFGNHPWDKEEMPEVIQDVRMVFWFDN
jgi:hypothetical protein